MKRRDFLRTAGMVTAGSGLLIGTGGLVTGCAGKESGGNIPKPYKKSKRAYHGQAIVNATNCFLKSRNCIAIWSAKAVTNLI